MEPQSSYFRDRSFDQVLDDGLKKPPRKKICGAFLYEDTTTLLFSRTNYGKSILVFQFAYAAATGTSIDHCSALLNECDPMKVLVVDLELEDRDLAQRHMAVKNNRNPYLSNLRYLHEKVENDMQLGFHLLDKIEQAAIQHEAKLVIIDNISKLLPDALRPDIATMITSMLNKIRKVTNCSILVIGHTTKGNPLVCIQPTDYFGSAMLQNFFSELSYLDATKDGNFFLCHSKTKQKELYNQTVPVFSRGDHRIGLGFTFLSLQPLSEIQLPFNLSVKKRSRNMKKFANAITALVNAGFSQNEIAALCDVNKSSISRLLNTLP